MWPCAADGCRNPGPNDVCAHRAARWGPRGGIHTTDQGKGLTGGSAARAGGPTARAVGPVARTAAPAARTQPGLPNRLHGVVCWRYWAAASGEQKPPWRLQGTACMGAGQACGERCHAPHDYSLPTRAHSPTRSLPACLPVTPCPLPHPLLACCPYARSPGTD